VSASAIDPHHDGHHDGPSDHLDDAPLLEEQPSPVPVVVRRNAGLAALIGAAASAIAIAYLWRAVGTQAPLDWALCAVLAGIAALHLVQLVDARTPLLVADDLGVRIRFGHQWRGLPWDAIDEVVVQPARGPLRDGRLIFRPHSLARALDGLDAKGRRAAALHQKMYGAALAVPLGLTTRTSAGREALEEGLATLAQGRAELVVLRPARSADAADEHGSAVDDLPWDDRSLDGDPEVGVGEQLAEVDGSDGSAPDDEVDDRTRPRRRGARVALGGLIGRLAGRRADDRRADDTAADADTDDDTGTDDTAEADDTDHDAVRDDEAAAARVADQDAPDSAPREERHRGLRGAIPLRDRRHGVRADVGDPGTSGMPATLGNAAMGNPALGNAASGNAALGNAALLPSAGDDRRAGADSLPEVGELRRAGDEPADTGLAQGGDGFSVLGAQPDDPFADGRVRPIARLGEPVEPLVVDDFVTEPAYDPVIGPELAAARTRVGLSVDELAERTRIRPHVIESIEVDDFGPCGGDFYARGHLRTLARVLGREPAPLLAVYEQRYATAPIGAKRVFEAELATGMTGSMRRTTGSGPNWALLVGVVLALLLTWGVVRLFDSEPAEVLRPAPSLDSGSAGVSGQGPVAKASPAVAPAATPAPIRVALHGATTSGSSVVVRDRTGEIVWAGTMTTGELKTVRATPPVTVHATDAGAIDVSVNGSDAGAVGQLGQAGKRSFSAPR